MLLVKESQGDSLIGAIDGTNATYTTSLDFAVEFVNVFVNGQLKVAALSDGYSLAGTRTIIMAEPLQVGDTLEVEYRSKAFSGGGAPGGAPSTPSATILTPVVSATILPDYE